MSDDLDLLEAPESSRPSDPGGEVLALRFMVNELVREPAPALDWERVEARLFARSEAGAGGGFDEAAVLASHEPQDLDGVSTAGSETHGAATRVAEGRGDERAASSERRSVAGLATSTEMAVPLAKLGARPGSAERSRTRRGSSKVRARSFGLWAAAVVVLGSAAAFAWFERAGAQPEPHRDGVARSDLPPSGATGTGPARSAISEGRSVHGAPAARATNDRPAAESDGVRAPLAANDGARGEPMLDAPIDALPGPSSGASVGDGAPPRAAHGDAKVGTTRLDQPAVSTPESSPQASPSMSDAELTSTVHSCLKARAQLPSSLEEGVERRIESSLSVRVEPDGTVGSVSFHPPLRPELQSCARFVLSVRLGEGPRELRVPIVLE